MKTIKSPFTCIFATIAFCLLSCSMLEASVMFYSGFEASEEFVTGTIHGQISSHDANYRWGVANNATYTGDASIINSAAYSGAQSLELANGRTQVNRRFDGSADFQPAPPQTSVVYAEYYYHTNSAASIFPTSYWSNTSNQTYARVDFRTDGNIWLLTGTDSHVYVNTGLTWDTNIWNHVVIKFNYDEGNYAVSIGGGEFSDAVNFRFATTLVTAFRRVHFEGSGRNSSFGDIAMIDEFRILSHNPIPEPATIAMIISTSLAAMILIHRRRTVLC